ncbi:hypothetical protein GCM10010517_59130 [Streptosporangium fragile]|uniref:Carboxypeptidase regulatory-like domain-containing protein n=1 Tax=Streptosporangium fragile TaxID=46186 RepID=A0ABN3W796_9ACTN
MNDDELERELRRAGGLFDPVPSDLLQTAVEAFALRTLDAELAELAFDSLTEPARVRGEERPRMLTFHAPGLTVDLEITGGGADGRVVGQLIPPQAARIELLGRQPAALTADDLGRFVCEVVPTGPFSLRCRLAGAVVATEWVTV